MIEVKKQNETSKKDIKEELEEKVEITVRPDGEWEIQDYLLDSTWKSLLEAEFEKKYFIEINKFIKNGYQKNINRPPKELVFNAFNSTKISQVC